MWVELMGVNKVGRRKLQVISQPNTGKQAGGVISATLKVLTNDIVWNSEQAQRCDAHPKTPGTSGEGTK